MKTKRNQFYHGEVQSKSFLNRARLDTINNLFRELSLFIEERAARMVENNFEVIAAFS